MNRLTKKFGDKVILPIIIANIESEKDYKKFHDVRREYENNTIKLAEYEDIGTLEEFN